MEWQFFDDPVEFLDVAGDHLAEQPVLSTVIAGVAQRVARNREEGVPWPEGVPCWFAVVLDDDVVIGTAMRTAPFGEYPAYVMPMPHDAAVLLAERLLERDEVVLAANGALPAVEVFCEAMARATGRTAEVGQHTRLFELGELKEPAPVSGRMRPATPEDQDLVQSWYDAFMIDADLQAGREPGEYPHESPTPDEMRRRIDTGRVFVWELEDGTLVNVTAASRPTYGVSRIGPVYTPREHRGHGYGSATVAGASRLLRDSGERVCLFTDQANPTSNKIYEALGFERLVDMANLRVS